MGQIPTPISAVLLVEGSLMSDVQALSGGFWVIFLLSVLGAAALSAWLSLRWARGRASLSAPATSSVPERPASIPSPEGLAQVLAVQVFVLDLRPLKAVLDELRSKGVVALASYLENSPETLPLWQRKLSLVWASTFALQKAGVASVVQLQERLREEGGAPWPELFQGLVYMLWAGLQATDREITYVSGRKEELSVLARTRIPEGAEGQELGSAVLMLIDLTVAKVEAKMDTSGAKVLRDIFSHSNILLWWAKVHRKDGAFQWRMHMPEHSEQSPLYRLAGGMSKGGLWDMDVLPDAAKMNALSEEAMLTGKRSYRNEFRVPSKEGLHWVSEEVIVQQLAPDAWNLVGLATDVTERHKAEEAREAAERNMHQILQGADCLLWRARVQATPPGTHWTMFVPPSALYRRIFGHDPDNNSPLLWHEQEIPERDEIYARSTRALYEGWPEYDQEFRVIVGGHTFWLHEHVTIQKLSPSEWHLVGVIIDISARRETEQQLATEKERLAVTLRAMNEGVITLDGRGAVLFMNRAAAELTQWDAEELAGKPLEDWCQLQLDGTAEKVPLPVQQVLRDGIAYYFPINTRCLGRKGRSSLVEGCLMPVSDACSRRVGAVIVVRDITEQRQMELQIHRKEKLESIGILAGGIAHDFNNILTAIMGNLTLLQMEAEGQENLAPFLKEAVDATLRAKDLTQQLITFAKGGEPVRTVVALPKLIEDAAQFVVRGSNVACEYSFPEDLWSVDADKGQLSQVIHNLMLNSVQAMPNGGRIRFLARNERTDRQTMPTLSPGLYVCLSVEDSGTGISPEHIGKIFDPYFTTKQMGHGLGLAAVYSIIKKHKGHIEVSSQVGEGTCLRLWLPASIAQKPVAKVDASRLKTSSIEGRRLLIMDDEEAILKLVSRMTRRMGIEVETCLDGQAAVDRYQTALKEGRRFDAVLMDLTVPGGMGGKEALDLMKAVDPKVCAVVTSGYSNDRNLDEYLSLGFRGMVAKPYEMGELTRVIRQVLIEETHPE